MKKVLMVISLFVVACGGDYVPCDLSPVWVQDFSSPDDFAVVVDSGHDFSTPADLTPAQDFSMRPDLKKPEDLATPDDFSIPTCENKQSSCVDDCVKSCGSSGSKYDSCKYDCDCSYNNCCSSR